MVPLVRCQHHLHRIHERSNITPNCPAPIFPPVIHHLHCSLLQLFSWMSTYQKLCWQQILKSLLLQNKPINKTKWPILSKYIKTPKYTHKVHTQLLHSCNALQGITVAQKGGLFSKWQQGLGNYVYPSLRLLANLQIQMWHPQKHHVHCIYSDLTLYLTIKTINTIFILQGIVDETS